MEIWLMFYESIPVLNIDYGQKYQSCFPIICVSFTYSTFIGCLQKYSAISDHRTKSLL